MCEIFAVFGVNGNEFAGIQGRSQPLQISNGRMPAGVGEDEVDCRVASVGGDLVAAVVVSVLSIEIVEPLRVNDVDGGCGVLEFIDEVKAGHLAEVEERFGSCAEFLDLDPLAIESVLKSPK